MCGKTLPLIVRLCAAMALVLWPLGSGPVPAHAACVPSPTNGDDVIVCDAANDSLNARAGNDVVYGGAGNDTLNGQAGNDTLYGETGNDSLTGGAGNDALYGGPGNDTYRFDIDSALGTDTVTEAAGEGTDALNFSGSTTGISVDLSVIGDQGVHPNLTLNLTAAEVENVTGGNGNDVIFGNDRVNSLSGGNGNDTLSGRAGNDRLSGGAGNDTLIGSAGNDTLIGGAGDDVYLFDTSSPLGTDTVTEAASGGRDTLDFSGSPTGILLDLGVTTNQVVNPNLTLRLSAVQVEDVIGGDGDDQITGSGADNALSGGAGNDVLRGQGANDTLLGGDGDDDLEGGPGEDVLRGEAGDDTLTTSDGIDDLDGGDGDDLLILTGTHVAGDVVSGGSGSNSFRFMPGTDGELALVSSGDDTLDFSQFDSPVSIDLGNPSQQHVGGGLWLTLTGWFRNVIGTLFGDVLIGNGADNHIQGLDGDDTLDGGPGVDTLDGGPGTDTVQNYEEADTHLDIEVGLPTPTPTPSPTPTPTPVPTPTAIPPANPTPSQPAPHRLLIPVTGHEPKPLSCQYPVTRLTLPGRDWVEFINLCSYQAIVSQEAVEGLPGELPRDATVVSALTIALLQGTAPVETLPLWSRIVVSFEASSLDEDAHFAILYWDPHLDDGLGGWVELPSMDPEEWWMRPLPLHADQLEEARFILRGVLRSPEGRPEVAINFSGTFVLVEIAAGPGS